jgi:NAD(P)H-nitrite reductase large subunit
MADPKAGGAIPQRDGKGFAIMTRIPAGITKPKDLERIAAIGKKYRIPIMKITSGQRIILAGIAEEDVPKVFADLGPLARPEVKPGVKFVQACLGTEMCRYGSQDSIALAGQIEKRLYNKEFPAKVKIGVSGCQRCCSESQLRDVGIIGTTRGWMVFFGGNAGTKPRIGDLIVSGLSSDEAIDCTVRLLEYYRDQAQKKERTARFMERKGIEAMKRELLSMIPYIPLEKV